MSSSLVPAQLFSITLTSQWLLEFVVHWSMVLVLLGVSYFFLKRKPFLGRRFEIDQAEFGHGSNKLRFVPSYADKQLAYSLWVELSTRKIGQEIDLEHDVIVEVYDSWYAFFKITRDHIKAVPARRIVDPGTRAVIDLSIDVLNFGMRPHLTTWQAKFRDWYKRRSEELAGGVIITPQELQRQYPSFEELRLELAEVNRSLILYRKKMGDLAFGV